MPTDGYNWCATPCSVYTTPEPTRHSNRVCRRPQLNNEQSELTGTSTRKSQPQYKFSCSGLCGDLQSTLRPDARAAL